MDIFRGIWVPRRASGGLLGRRLSGLFGNPFGGLPIRFLGRCLGGLHCGPLGGHLSGLLGGRLGWFPRGRLGGRLGVPLR